MAKKKKKEAFDPLGYQTIPQANIVNSNYEQYPDVGVEYKGYAKIFIGNGYKLLKQYPFSDSITDTNVTGTIYYSFLGNPPPVGQTLYVKSMQLNLSVSALDLGSHIRIRDGGTSGNIVWQWLILRSDGLNFTFDVPLKWKESFVVELVPSGITVNSITLAIQGWFEDNP